MKRLAPVVCLALAAVACTTEESNEPAETKRFEAVGTVVAVEGDFVLIDHEDIAGFMDAMTMSFPVRDATILSGVEVGDRVRFGVVVAKDASYTVEHLETLDRGDGS